MATTAKNQAAKATTPDEAEKVQAVTVDLTADKTLLDDSTTKPATVKPGDAPADTLDPTERASTVVPHDLSDEALAAGTVNGVAKLPNQPAPEADEAKDRVEKYDVRRPDGSTVKVEHNIDTGETKVIG